MDYEKVEHLFSTKYSSNRQMAKAIGMSHEGFSSMMKRHSMSVETLEIIARHFNKPLSYFFTNFYCDPDSLELPLYFRCTNEDCLKEIHALINRIKELDALNSQLIETVHNLSQKSVSKKAPKESK